MRGQIEFADVKEQLGKAIFLDRDGVINTFTPGDPDVPESWYVLEWGDFHFIPEALEGLKLLVDTDYKIFVISNQSGIGRGLVGYPTIYDLFVRMVEEIYDKTGCFISDCKFCPHSPDAGCACRKPKPGLIYSLVVDNGIDLSKSWMIGDQESDIEAGLAAGIPPAQLIMIKEGLIDEDYGTRARHCRKNLYEAAEMIIATSETSS